MGVRCDGYFDRDPSESDTRREFVRFSLDIVNGLSTLPLGMVVASFVTEKDLP
jgi:hypothetical protein